MLFIFSMNWYLNFMYMSILSKLLDIHEYPFWATCHHAYIVVDSFVSWICMYTLVCIRHTYTLKIKFFFDDFLFKGIIELNWTIFFMIVISTLDLYTHIYYLLMFCVHETFFKLNWIRVLIIMWFSFLWKIICIYSLLEGFRTS